MTILTGNLQSVSGTPFGGPGHFVVIYSRVTRPGFSADALILELQDRIPMTTTSGGHFETGQLDPGPIRVELEGGTVHGRGWDIDLPESGTHSLANLIDAQVEWSPAVVGRAEAAATEAAQAAVRAESAAVLLESALATAVDSVRVEVAADADRAVHARQGAEAARDAALAAQTGAEAAAAGAAADVRTELVGLSESAQTAASAAEGSATAAAGSASAAEVSATSASVSAGAAESAVTEAAGQVSAAQAAATSAGEDASAAAISATNAQGAETAAAGSAAQADAAAVTATLEADRALSEADRAEAAAQSASTGVQPDTVGRLHLTPALRGEIDGKAEAGHTHLWEDVTGKPDAFPPADHTHTWNDVSAKPASFPPSVHSHVVADVDGLQDALDGKAPVSHDHTIEQVTDLQGELDGKAPSVHNHDGAYYTKAQADGRYVGTSGNSTKTGNLDMDGGSVRYVRPDTTYGWARGLWWVDRDYTTLAGIGVQGFAGEVTSFYLGHGNEPWDEPVFRAYQDFISITNLDVTGSVTGIDADDVGAAPADHTHSEYATTAQVEARTPEIRVVSSPELATSPGVLYVVMED